MPSRANSSLAGSANCAIGQMPDQMHRASCLHLLMAAIAAWNTVYLTKAIETLRKRGEDIPEATVAHIAPLGWEHIRLIGDYHFAPQSGRSLDNLRPLRL